MSDTINIPPSIEKALSQYFCFIPALTKSLNSQWVDHRKSYPLDKCIFVGKAMAESQKCEGLQLFRNTEQITSNNAFCDGLFGKYLSFIIVCLVIFFINR